MVTGESKASSVLLHIERRYAGGFNGCERGYFGNFGVCGTATVVSVAIMKESRGFGAIGVH